MKSLFLFFFFISSSMAFAQAKLELMVQERDALHAQYKASENKKSGIFGTRTKKDMIESNEWLERIIVKDNLIMDELRLSGAIENTSVSQEKEDYKSITLKLEQDVQALKRAVAEREKQIAEKSSERRTFEWVSLILFWACLGLGYWGYKQKTKLKKLTSESLD
ncbi:MAG: Clp protease ClpB [Algoriphagus sp.]|nr:Clp protease ClpB [Algoriphagus sp.]